MFTGIITDIGRVAAVAERDQGVSLRIETAWDPATIDIGASIACSGVCLTVTALPAQGDNSRWFEVEAWEEALRLTSIGTWTAGTRINLERSLKIGDELGGHMVSGHVDGQAEIIAIKDEGEARRFTLRAPGDLSRFIAPKGSVALDGTSLTVNAVEGRTFGLNIIPHTWDHTTLGGLQVGNSVNLEIDMLAR